MEEIAEIPSAEAQDGQKSHSARLERGGILSAIGKLSGKLRAAIAALGLLWGGEMGCAHKPIIVPPSIAQQERKICIASKTQLDRSEAQSVLISELKKYLMERYRNIIIDDIDDDSNALKNRCDDAIEVASTTSVKRYAQKDAASLPKDIITIRGRVSVFNTENNNIVYQADGETEDSESSLKCGLKWIQHGVSHGEYDYVCKDRNTPPTEMTEMARDELEDLIEDILLDGYRPEQLPSLSLARIEQEKVREDFEKVAEAAKKQQLNVFELMAEFRRKYPASEYLQKIDEMYKRLIEKVGLREVKITNGRIPIRVQKDIETIDTTGDFFEVGETILVGPWTPNELPFTPFFTHYFASAIALDGKKKGLIWAEEFNEINFPKPPPRKIPEGMVFWRPGIDPDPSRPGAGFEEGFKMLRDTVKAVVVSPEFGAMVEKLVEVSDKIHQDLAREGFTAHLELRIVKPEFLSDKPIQNVDVTVIQKNPPYTSRTFSTTKEGIIEQGGRANFYLRPGQYEITSPIFKDRYTVNVKEGQNSLTIELR